MSDPGARAQNNRNSEIKAIAAHPAHAEIVQQMLRAKESGARTEDPPATPPSCSKFGGGRPSAPSTRTVQGTFLARFVKDAAHGPQYHDLLVAAGVSEDGLRPMALLDAGFARDFLRGLVPESSAADRVLFALTVHWLG
ncbi:hypothetical protein FB451DRAFT_1558662 [Mycena latifolia]|nr:hypothetical protein FB451DRAFT_1558662 [Mycena latifolia]